jgi:glycosyltransferase involved in cell wall biosynthesis
MMAPRVLRIVTRLNVGGPARQAVFLSGALERRGFETELVSGSVGQGEGELVPTDGLHTRIPELRRPLDPIKDPQAARAVRRLVRARRPHVVHTHMAKAGALGRLAAHRARVPVVIHTFHGHVLEGYFGRPVTAAFLAAERRLARWSDVLVAVSPAVRDELLALRIGEPSRWRVIPLGLELDDLLAPAPAVDESRRRLRLPQQGPIVGIVGRLVPIKDHVTFLEAAAKMAARRPDLTFVAAGDGELRSALETKGREMLGDRIRFLGWVSDLPSLYAAMDVAVLTSRNEGTPVSLIEAGAAARPVVSTRVGGVDDVVRDGVTGVLTPAGDAEAIAAGVLGLLEDPGRARAMGQAAREQVPGRFSAERLADDLADLYRELLARAGDHRSPIRGSHGAAG